MKIRVSVLSLLLCFCAEKGRAHMFKPYIYPTLPREIVKEKIEEIDQEVTKRWKKVLNQKITFAKYQKKSPEEIDQEYSECEKLRFYLLFEDPTSTVRISQKDYMISQSLLESGNFRSINNLAFEYNNTEKFYNASTVLLEGNHFIALQEPTESTLNLFKKLLINHRAVILVRLKPESEFNKKGSVKYWMGNLVEQDRKMYLKLVVEESLKSIDPVLVPYVYTDSWVDDKGVDVKELYRLVNEVKTLSSQLGDQGPIAVHCASGVGRTGTLIAALAIAKQLDQGKNPEEISVQEIVLKLSIQRPNMIATVEQYRSLYEFTEFYACHRS